MCGIIGYIGKRNAISVLIEGLKRLEYRGYDSAGIAFLENSHIEVVKQKGKIRELEPLVSRFDVDTNIGIGHTRWATHGEPSDINAHPHTDCTGKIAIVHNGIITNYSALKSLLVEEGHKIKSDTDSELIAHLIEKFYFSNGGDEKKAVVSALSLVEGTYGLVVLFSGKDYLIAARRGSPMIIGVGKEENFVASDVSAMLKYTDKVVYLEDGEIAFVYKGDIELSDLNFEKKRISVHKIDWKLSQIEKGKFPHFMLKEIYEQPKTLYNAFVGRINKELATTKLSAMEEFRDKFLSVDRIIITACGTSWHAALIGKYIIEDLARIPVEVDYASEFRYRNPVIGKDTIVFVISQSGETADTLGALREAKIRGATVLAITNVVGSTIARESDGGFYLNAGPEIGVASTKAFTSQIMVLALIGIYLGRMRRLSYDDGRRYIDYIEEIPKLAAKILKLDDDIKRIANKYATATNFLYLGRGYNFPVALEGALKLKEISYIHAEGYPSAEMKHGPIALIDDRMPVVVIAIRDSVYDKVIANIEEVKSRRGDLILIGNEGDNKLSEFSENVILVPETVDFLSPILTVIPLQLLAYHIAAIRGCDIDQPRNLAKSVTVE
jgi:glucosamine--fructose-6-phosphate aminotransferase (isomerizing)